jgi:hypothetical protein
VCGKGERCNPLNGILGQPDSEFATPLCGVCYFVACGTRFPVISSLSSSRFWSVCVNSSTNRPRLNRYMVRLYSPPPARPQHSSRATPCSNGRTAIVSCSERISRYRFPSLRYIKMYGPPLPPRPVFTIRSAILSPSTSTLRIETVTNAVSGSAGGVCAERPNHLGLTRGPPLPRPAARH